MWALKIRITLGALIFASTFASYVTGRPDLVEPSDLMTSVVEDTCHQRIIPLIEIPF